VNQTPNESPNPNPEMSSAPDSGLIFNDLPKKPENKPGATRGTILQLAPFLLPALLFQSALLAFISPLPFLILSLRKSLPVVLLAFATNTAILYYFQRTDEGRAELPVALLYWIFVGVVFPFLMRRGRPYLLSTPPDRDLQAKRSFLVSFVLSAAAIFGILAYLAHAAQMDVIPYVKAQIATGVDRVAAIPDSPLKPLIEEQGRDSLLKEIYTEFPSAILITLILGLWGNLLFASQFVPGFLSRGFWSGYRNPEWLVAPTLVAAGLFAFGDHALYFIGLNSIKVILVLYGFQGLSIMSSLLNKFKIFGFVRALLFSVAVFLTMPLVLSFGFFDLWFDFRKKFGQS
jgi:hypothetical protein